MHGYVHSVESGGTVDGPGIRFVVFLSGCPLRCVYCHNPDCMKAHHSASREAEDVAREAASYKSFMKCGGGVTISGGEPLAQPGFVKELLRECKKLGLHTALDTSGFLGRNADQELLDLTDLVLLDIKSGLPETYRQVTGGELEPTIDFAHRLAGAGKPVWVRFVLVPGVTDAPENIQAVAKICAGLSNIERVDILPFHKMAEYKWENLGLSYSLKDTPPPTPEQLEVARAIFAQEGVKTF